jgi:hypothetical protein
MSVMAILRQLTDLPKCGVECNSPSANSPLFPTTEGTQNQKEHYSPVNRVMRLKQALTRSSFSHKVGSRWGRTVFYGEGFRPGLRSNNLSPNFLPASQRS